MDATQDGKRGQPSVGHAPVGRGSPYVCLSAQCSLLDSVGLHQPPHAFSVLDANSVLTRGREGLTFRVPALAHTMPRAAMASGGEGETTTRQKEEGEAGGAGAEEPGVVVSAPDLSGHGLFSNAPSASLAAAAAAMHRDGVDGSAYAAAVRACRDCFDGIGTDALTAAPGTASAGDGCGDSAKEDGGGASAVASLTHNGDGSGERVPQRSAALTAPIVVCPLPAALVRRTLLQVLLILRLRGRSPAAVFTLCQTSSSSSSCPPHPSDGLLSDVVRFAIAPRAAAAATPTESGSDVSFTYEVGVEGDADVTRVTARERRRTRAEREGGVTVEPTLSLQCRVACAQRCEGSGGVGDVFFAEIDLPAVLSAAAQPSSVGSGIASLAVFLQPELLLSSATNPSGGLELSVVGSASGDTGGLNAYLRAARIASKLFCYHQPPSRLVGESDGGASDAVQREDVTDVGDARLVVPVASFTGFLQRACFRFLSFLTHLSWSRHVAQAIAAAVREKSGSACSAAADDTRGTVTVSVLVDALTEQTSQRAGPVFREPSADGFTSLLLIGPRDAVTVSAASPSSSKALLSVRSGVRVCLVRVHAAREELTWKSLLLGSSLSSCSGSESRGTLHALLAACF